MIAKGAISLSLNDILDYVSESTIVDFYLGVDSVPAIICNPTRDDKHPSLELHYSDPSSDKITFYDYGTCESGGIFDLLMKLFCLSFNDLLIKINNELILGKNLQRIERRAVQPKKYVEKIQSLNVKTRPWRQHDIDFWNSYGIEKRWCEFGDIHPISHMFIKKGNREHIIPAERYSYAYAEFKDNETTFKIYQPFSENYKWINKHDMSVWDLWSKLPQNGKNLIITSSRKDALCIWCNLGVPSVSLQAESYLPKENVMLELKERFENIFLLYDNDFSSKENWGRINSQKLHSLYSFLNVIEIPDEYKSKDPSDLYKNHGKDTFLQVINFLIKNDK